MCAFHSLLDINALLDSEIKVFRCNNRPNPKTFLATIFGIGLPPTAKRHVNEQNNICRRNRNHNKTLKNVKKMAEKPANSLNFSGSISRPL